MAIQLSPSVVVQEKDSTNVIPAVTSSIGACVIDAAWGPVSQITSIQSETELVQRFGKPPATAAENWFTVANFLGYSSAAEVVRTDTVGQVNAVATPSKRVTAIVTTSSGYTTAPTVELSAPAVGTTATAVATLDPLNVGKILITVTNSGSGYSAAPTVTLTKTTPADTPTTGTTTVTMVDGGTKIQNISVYNSDYVNGSNGIGAFAARYAGTLGNSISVAIADSAQFASWPHAYFFQAAPSTSEYVSKINPTGMDEMHILVIDSKGMWTGKTDTILESYPFVSKASDAKTEDGASAYYKNVINANSKYIYWTDAPNTVQTGSNIGVTAAAAGTTAFKALGTGQTPAAYAVDLSGGSDDFESTDQQKRAAYAMLANQEEIDVNLIMAGKASFTVAQYIISNVAEARKDCIACISPGARADGSRLTGQNADVVDDLLKYKNGDTGGNPSLPSSSYVVYDTGYKYQYDRYNDVYRWVPLNGDIAGVCARTDYTNDPWFSPAGMNRGQIKNVVKLSISPTATLRDKLYLGGINPVVAFPGQGVMLYGDKTGLAKPSAFDRINVRRLFITLEKAIATAAKYQLFEFNDSFTRAQFRNMVEPFLRDVQGRRGITDFKVIVDESNNTAEVIDTNRFVADIYIKPSRSINFIQLNFVATRSGASFTEIAG